MPIPREVRIIKVPLSDKQRVPDYPKSFPRMKTLYLELLENKAKIKQDLINVDYKDRRSKTDDDNKIRDAHDKTQDRVHDKTHEGRDEDLKKSRKENTEIREEVNEDEPKEVRKDPEDTEIRENDRKDSISDSDSSKPSSRASSRASSQASSKSDESDASKNSHDSHDSHDSHNTRESHGSRSSKNSDESDALSERLKELLGEDNPPEKESRESRESPRDKHHDKPPRQTSHFTPYNKYKEQPVRDKAPTLAELEAKGHYQGKQELRDINHITKGEYEDEDKKRELIFKFDLLKKSYPISAPTIPEYTIHSDLREMQKSYESTVRRLSLDSSVENYKNYLVWGFMGTEFVLGNFLGLDMQGFTQQQIISMHSYEKLLIELGEKSYVPTGSKYPVELRLLFLIIINAGAFIVSKMIMRKTGANILNSINSMNTPPTQTPSQARPKRRMKGPNINLEDIPDVEENTAKAEN